MAGSRWSTAHSPASSRPNGGIAAVSSTAAASKTYRNCTALNKVYPHGVGRVGARDKTSGTLVRNFKRSNLLYRQNKGSDRDKDGIACEKK